MYHYELRKFPHTFCVFNQSEQQLRAIVAPWTTGEWVEVGERTWNIYETKLTILEGPELALPDLAMNRGWRNAKRRSDDVTERVLAAGRAATGASQPNVGPGAGALGGEGATALEPTPTSCSPTRSRSRSSRCSTPVLSRRRASGSWRTRAYRSSPPPSRLRSPNARSARCSRAAWPFCRETAMRSTATRSSARCAPSRAGATVRLARSRSLAKPERAALDSVAAWWA